MQARPCIASLWLSKHLISQVASLPLQVPAGLPALRSFELAESNYTTAGLTAVSGLAALTRLMLSRVNSLPPAEALAALAPSLRVLEVHSVVYRMNELNSILSDLTALESLALDIGLWEGADLVPPALAGLSRLSCLSLSCYSAAPDAAAVQGTPFTPLSTLPFSSLGWLALPLPLAVALSGSLAEAQHLDTLCLLLPSTYAHFDGDPWPMLWQFATTHPSLRRLLYEVRAQSQPCSYQLLDALLQLRLQRPALQVRRLTALDNRTVNPPACWEDLRAQHGRQWLVAVHCAPASEAPFSPLRALRQLPAPLLCCCFCPMLL